MELLGTIIASYLDYDNLIAITGDPNIINVTVSKWIPADGRSIIGSKLANRTTKTEAPDLRGKFLRGLNQFYSVGEPNLNQLMANPENKTLGAFQEDRVGKHTHPILTNDDGTPISTNNYKTTAYSKRNGITINSESNDNNQIETRPKNISVFYYIKIND